MCLLEDFKIHSYDDGYLKKCKFVIGQIMFMYDYDDNIIEDQYIHRDDYITLNSGSLEELINDTSLSDHIAVMKMMNLIELIVNEIHLFRKKTE